MNILVTNWCNRRECTFCFEQSVAELKSAGYPQNVDSAKFFITEEHFRYLLGLAAGDWRSPRVCLLGGEPTQHPLVAQFAAEALDLGLDVLVVTNGVIDRARRRELSGLLYSERGRKLLFLVNPYLRRDQPAAELQAIRETLAWMRSAATLSVTVADDRFDLSPFGELIREFHLNTLIRVSLAHPMLEHANTYAARENFQQIGRALKSQGRRLMEDGIRLLCDCGFVACMFADDARPGERPEAAIRRGLDELEGCGIFFKSVCHPLLDVSPDLKASHCLPLASNRLIQLEPAKSVGRETVAAELSAHFKNQLHTYLFDACNSCELRTTGLCVAGCMSYRLRIQRPARV